MLSLRSVVETGHPRNETQFCAPNEKLIINGNSGIDFPFFNGGRGLMWEVVNQFGLNDWTDTNIVRDSTPGSSTRWRWDTNTPARANVADYTAVAITHISSGMNVGGSDFTVNYNFLEIYDIWVNHYWENADNGNGKGKIWFIGTQARLDRPDYMGNVRRRHELWSMAQDQSNIKRPADCPRVQLIPVYFAYQKIREDQETNDTPTATFFDDLYSDHFHQNDTGRYIHLVFYMACMYGVDPRNVTPQPQGLTLTLTESEYIRQVCYDVMHWTERHGVDVAAWDN